MMTTLTCYHPRRNDQGQRVRLKHPSTPTALDAWANARQSACVVPDGPMPAQINGIAVQSWYHAPTTPEGWERRAQTTAITEPAFNAPPGYKKAAGAVIIEPDQRVWLVAPSNAFGGYQATFPKGTLESGVSAQASALIEVFEETGLQVQLQRHLIDVPRSLSYTRYYLARRVGGSPADMGWESQAVLLVPVSQLARHLNSPYDVPVLNALLNILGEPR
ncbi:MAG: NUDIX hydrolase [Pusillimonas sp.]